MRKKLPKAIGQTIDDLRRGKPNTRDETKSTRVSLASIPSPVPGVRAGDVLADEIRKRLKAVPAMAAARSEPRKPASAARRPTKVDAPAVASSKKPPAPE